MGGLRVIFMGTPEFAVPALASLCAGAHEVIAVYSQPPRPRGRGQQVQNSPVHEFALENNIPVFTPKTLKDTAAQGQFAALKADIAVVAAYGLLLPPAILEAPKHGCLNIHASLLPRWRGASPIQQAIWKGDTETGVTIMQMDAGLDTGPMLVKESVPVTNETTAVSLQGDLSALGARMIVKVLNDIAAGKPPPAQAQDDALATHAPLLKKEDGHIDWTQTAAQIDRQVRALNPWPGTFSGELKIRAAHATDRRSDHLPGTILDREGHVACGGGVLCVLKIQPAGKQAMDFSAAVNGGYIAPGTVLS